MDEGQATVELSRIRGVGIFLASRLYHAGFDSIAAIAAATPEALCRVSGVGPGTAPGLIAAASELLVVEAAAVEDESPEDKKARKKAKKTKKAEKKAKKKAKKEKKKAKKEEKKARKKAKKRAVETEADESD